MARPRPAADEPEDPDRRPEYFVTPSAFESAPGQKQKKGRKRRKQATPAAASSPAGWAAWIDPATLLWLPLLAPALALSVGAAIFSLNLPDLSFAGGGNPVKISFLFAGLCFALAAVPLAFVVRQWFGIGAAWALGGDRDPQWPGVDVGDLFHHLLRSVVCTAAAALLSAPLLWIPATGAVASALRFGALFVFTVYLVIAMIGVSLFDAMTACNPATVIAALWRMHYGRLSFLAETAVHVAVYFGFFLAIRAGWAYAFDVGLLLWLCWWIYVVPAVGRLMRCAGLYYRLNAGRVGWFNG